MWIAGPTIAFSLACSGATPDYAEAPTREDAPAAAAPAVQGGDGATLVSVVAGDVSCYLELAGGGPRNADFELCPGGAHDATPWIGQKVTVTTRKAEVMAASCAGNPECPDHDVVDLIMTVTPAGAEAAGEPAETCPRAVLEEALAQSDVAQAVNSKTLSDVKCNLTWATAHTVPPPDADGATVLFSRSAKGTWMAVNAGTSGWCDEVPEGDRAGLDCD
jgi:hypothetical protein